MRISDWSSDVCSSDLRIESIRAQASSADRMVDAVARANGGRYSVDLHLRHDLQASESYAVSHVRRLEAMRRAGAGPERQADGSWTIPHDHLARVEAFAQRQHRDRPVAVSILSPRQIGRASGRERVCQYLLNSGVAV